MALRLYNTLSGKIEEFQPERDNTVRFYACGPTVYDYGHIGNFRTFVAVDVLRRFLRQSGYGTNHVMNITDVDDKIIRNAVQRGMSIFDYTKKYVQAFLDDMKTVGIQQPEKIVRATDHIEEMAHFIHELERSGVAYKTEDGSYYFRIAKFPGQCARLRIVEGPERRRSEVGDGDRSGTAGVAYRVLDDEHEVSR